MKLLLAALLSLAALLATGCFEVRQDNSLTAEVKRDYSDVVAMSSAEKPPPAPSTGMVVANYAYQFPAKWLFAYPVSTTLAIPPYLLGEVFVAALTPATAFGYTEYQDRVDDAVYYTYKEGANFRRLWNLPPPVLDDKRYDLVERDHREGLPQPIGVAADRYPYTQDLTPPAWDAPPRPQPGPQPGPEPQPQPGPEGQPK
ncbi:MAG: hypothetical protein HY720_22930 [Planctomycetes bacterium]|nr:hypothetical protein [Planctomycetota bacterium]